MAAMMKGGIPFSNPPGLAYEYSNYGFAILGRIVASASGTSYSDYLSKNILQPLRLSATTLEPANVPAQNLAHGYRWEDDQWKNKPLLGDGAFGPMGGMLTSISDLGRYVGFLMNAWPPRDDADPGPVRRSSLREMQQIARWRPSRVTLAGADNTAQLNSGGYGYGLGITQTCAFGHVVAHSGGLPGFGSQMRWLPEYGVGIIALGNLTYTGWGGVITRAFDALERTGALQPRIPQPAPALVTARKGVARLILNWNDALADSVAAINLFLDGARERRRVQVATLRERAGECRDDGSLEVENPLRGRWRMLCERGALDVAITLSPTIPPLVQYLEVSYVNPVRPRAAVTACPMPGG
jgi:CubicO group peptidase (beta-lactamase class C family)